MRARAVSVSMRKERISNVKNGSVCTSRLDFVIYFCTLLCVDINIYKVCEDVLLLLSIIIIVVSSFLSFSLFLYIRDDEIIMRGD